MSNIIKFPDVIARARRSSGAKGVEAFLRAYLSDGPKHCVPARLESMKISPEREFYDMARLALGLWCVEGRGGWWLALPGDQGKVPPMDQFHKHEPRIWKITASRPLKRKKLG
jgi:hypothetical protein